MKRSVYVVLLWWCVTLGYCVAFTAQDALGVGLKETFERYVSAVQKADLQGLFTLVTKNEEFLFLTAEGKLIDTREGYYKFHEEWFKEKDWEMPVELLQVQEGTDYGFTTAIFHYRSKTPEGGTRALDSYFTLIFRKEEGMWKVVADICTPIRRYVSEANPEIKYTPEQLFLLDTIKNRRTVRRYTSTPVLREHILTILDAARLAATAGNQQPWKFLVIQDKEKLARLRVEAVEWSLKAFEEAQKPSREQLQAARESVGKYLEGVLSAPVYVAVLVDSKAKYPDFIVQDGSLAAGNLMVAARALGYGTAFLTSAIPEANLKKFLGVPEQYKLICFMPIGVPEEWPKTPPKKSLEEVVIFESF